MSDPEAAFAPAFLVRLLGLVLEEDVADSGAAVKSVRDLKGREGERLLRI